MFSKLQLAVLIASASAGNIAAPDAIERVVAIAPGCKLGMGLDLQDGCLASAVLDASQKLVNQSVFKTTYYTQNVVDQSTFNSEVSSVTSAEGGGWGVSVSLGISFMRTSTMSSKSVSFLVGQSSTVYSNQIDNIQGLQLTWTAKSLLQADPKLFLDSYGTHFISGVVYGGSFMGSVTLWEKSTSESSSLDTFAKFDAQTIFFHANASEDFGKSMSSNAYHLDTFAKAEYSGGQMVQFEPSSPLEMGNSYKKWQAGFNQETAVPLKMVYSNWYEVLDVQNIVNAKGSSVMAMFNPKDVATETLEQITTELSKTNFVKGAVAHTQNWDCYATSSGLKFALIELEQTITQHLLVIQTLSNDQVLAIQAQLLKGDFSWFKGDSLNTNFNSIITQYKRACGAFCLNPYYPAALKANEACTTDGNLDHGASTYGCSALTNPVMTGLQFTHPCGQDYAYQEMIRAQCANIPGLAAVGGTTTTTAWQSHTPVSATSACPKGMFVTDLELSHRCGQNDTPSRSSKLKCASPVSPYSVDSAGCQSTPFHFLGQCGGNTNTISCPAGTVMTAITAKHNSGENLVYQEQMALTCCKLQSSFLKGGC